MSLRLALLLAVALLAGSCTEDVGTSVRLSLVYKDGWRMDGADIIVVADGPDGAEDLRLEHSGPISHELLVLVPDSLAGNVMPLEVFGVRETERISHGSAVALVRKGATVEATIVLARLPCGVFCELGQKKCQASGVIICEEDADGCLQLSEPKDCPSDVPFCTDGECGISCENECALGEGECLDTKTVRTCGEFDNDACQDYGTATTCPGTQVCYSGRCAEPCTHGVLNNTTLAGTGNGFTPAIAVDKAGGSHGVYSAGGSRQIRYGFRARAGTWPATWEDTGLVGENPSITVDKAGGVHVVAGGAAVVYSYLPPNGTTWEVSGALQTGTNIGISSSIAIANDGTPHIVFYDTANDTLRHGVKNGTMWTLEAVGTALGSRCDLAIAGTTLHVSSFDQTNRVWHSMLEAGKPWANEMVQDLSGSLLQTTAATSIAVDRGGTVHLVYSDLVGASDDLRYLHRTGGDWTDSPGVIDNNNSLYGTGAYPDLAIDPFDRMHVVYRSTVGTPQLRYATKSSNVNVTAWDKGVQPPNTSGVAPSIGIDPLGTVHVLSAATSIVETVRLCQ